MMSFRSLSLPMLTLVAVLAGCSAEAGTSNGASSANTVTEQPSALSTDNAKKPAFGPHHVKGGPDFLLFAALREPINLTAEQRTTIEGLVKADRPEPVADPARVQKLAAAIRNNTVETDLPRPAFDENAKNEFLAKAAKNLATLHDTLTAEQRSALVDSLAKHEGEHTKRGPAQGPDQGERGKFEHGSFEGHRGHDPMMGMLEGLDLTQAQKDEIKTKLEANRPAKPTEEQREAMKAKFETMRTEMQAKLQTFKSDTFDATAFVTPPKDFAPPATMQGPRTNPLAVITSVLTPAQREKLAVRIEQGPMKRAVRVNGAATETPQVAQ